MMTPQQIAAATAQYPYAYQQMGYWYPPAVSFELIVKEVVK